MIYMKNPQEYQATKYKGILHIKPKQGPLDKHGKYHLTKEELNHLEDNAVSNRDRIMISMMCRCGLRRAETRSMKIENIDFKRQRVFLEITKRSKPRVVPITTTLTRELKWLIGKREQGWTFESQKGNRLSLMQVNRIVAKAGKRAGLTNPDPSYKNINPHLLRHSFVYHAKKKHLKGEALSRIIGHSNTRLTEEMYGTLSMDDIQVDYDKIWDDVDE